MAILWIIAGWSLWGLTALVSAGLLLSSNRDGGVRFMMRTQGLVLALGLLATLALPISKFQLLWVFPVSFATPLVIMQMRVAKGIRRARSIISTQHTSAAAAQSQSRETLQKKLAQAQRDLEGLDNPETIFALGQMSYEGDGVPQNYVEAAGWFRIAAEHGHVRAAHNLALMYEEGKGAPQDCAEAAKWYRKAAEQGHAGSQNNLGVLLESGEGVSKDEAQALAWYRKAAANGDSSAVKNASRLHTKMKRDECNRLVDEFVDSISADGPPLIRQR